MVASKPGDTHLEADALVTREKAVALMVRTADCAPIALAAEEGVVGVCHGGWNGLMAGVLGATVEAMRRLGGTRIEAALGPCIRPCCYEFGPRDLDTVAAEFGETVRSEDARGNPALDLPAVVRSAAERAGAELVLDSGLCTSCAAVDGSHLFWSHRMRKDQERQGVLAWLN